MVGAAMRSRSDYIAHYRTEGLTPIPLHGLVSGACTCTTGDKCTSAGKHPRIKRQDALDATEQHWAHWLKTWPDMNIGILTGSDTGVFVLDVDPRHGGDESLKTLEAAHGNLPITLTAKTGGGGIHYLFQIPAGQTIRNSASNLASGLDIRGEGGLIVVAPSTTQGAYSWN